MLKAPGCERLKVKCDDLLSNVAFNFMLRHYTMEPGGGGLGGGGGEWNDTARGSQDSPRFVGSHGSGSSPLLAARRNSGSSGTDRTYRKQILDIFTAARNSTASMSSVGGTKMEAGHGKARGASLSGRDGDGSGKLRESPPPLVTEAQYKAAGAYTRPLFSSM